MSQQVLCSGAWRPLALGLRGRRVTRRPLARLRRRRRPAFLPTPFELQSADYATLLETKQFYASLYSYLQNFSRLVPSLGDIETDFNYQIFIFPRTCLFLLSKQEFSSY